MRYLLTYLFATMIYSCGNHSFDRDKRQLIAKSEIREKLKDVRDFDITGFQEDTLQELAGAAFKNLIRYKLNISYKDSLGTLQNKEAFVLFTPDGESVISAQIEN